MGQVEVEIVGPVVLSNNSERVIVIGLNEKNGKRGYLLRTSRHRADIIDYLINGTPPPNACVLSHTSLAGEFLDILSALGEKLEFRVDRVSFTELPNGTVYTTLHLEGGGKSIEIPINRPTVAMAVVISTKCKALMDDKLMGEDGYIDISKIKKQSDEAMALDSPNIDWSKVKE
ncbi:MAG: bifunctional nuclease family protein [Candidatus Colwellbacteria bacterium]|nr:bifunctional nuclease family protein [Candidatus Colwellbacteria bacterium]